MEALEVCKIWCACQYRQVWLSWLEIQCFLQLGPPVTDHIIFSVDKFSLGYTQICLNDQANIAWFTSTRGVYLARPRTLSLKFIRDQWRSTQLKECKLQNYRSLLLHVEREENNSWPGPFCFTCAISAYWGCHFLVQTLIPGLIG